MNKQNVIFIMLDQLRVDRLPVMPIFPRLKQQGCFFSKMFTYAPYTLASMHAVFTGMYGFKNGVNAYYSALDFDKENCYTLAQYFKELGYFTQADTLSNLLIPNQGFEEVGVYDEFKDDVISRHKGIINKIVEKKQPFFLYLHCAHIHTQMVENVIKKYTDFDEEYFNNKDANLASYDEYVKEVNSYVEEIFNTLDKLDLFNNSLVVLISDHGCSIGEKRGEKCYGVYTYDYSINTFAFLFHKSAISKGVEIKELTRTIDIAPTILDIFEIEQKKDFKTMQGESLLPILKGEEKDNKRFAYIETGGLGGPNPSPYKPNIKAIRSKEWKLIINEATGKNELYNLTNDSFEERNQFQENKEVVLKLTEEMNKILAT